LEAVLAAKTITSAEMRDTSIHGTRLGRQLEVVHLFLIRAEQSLDPAAIRKGPVNQPNQPSSSIRWTLGLAVSGHRRAFLHRLLRDAMVGSSLVFLASGSSILDRQETHQNSSTRESSGRWGDILG
jgi:hypothetical protein